MAEIRKGDFLEEIIRKYPTSCFCNCFINNKAQWKKRRFFRWKRQWAHGPTVGQQHSSKPMRPPSRTSSNGSSAHTTKKVLPPGIKGPTFKLQERRRGSRPKLTIVRPNPSSSSSSPCSYSFGPLISPSTSISKLRLSNKESSDSNSDSDSNSNSDQERFYLYSSPRGSRLRNVDPELLLLQLFPEP